MLDIRHPSTADTHGTGRSTRVWPGPDFRPRFPAAFLSSVLAGQRILRAGALATLAR